MLDTHAHADQMSGLLFFEEHETRLFMCHDYQPGGRLPEPEFHGTAYLRIPLDFECGQGR